MTVIGCMTAHGMYFARQWEIFPTNPNHNWFGQIQRAKRTTTIFNANKIENIIFEILRMMFDVRMFPSVKIH